MAPVGAYQAISLRSGNRRFREISEFAGARVIFQDIRIPKNGFRGMLRWWWWWVGGGTDDIIADDLVDVVSGDLLEIGGESRKKANRKR